MTRTSVGNAYRRIAVLAIAFAAAALVAIAIAMGTAQAAESNPNTSVSPAGTGSVKVELLSSESYGNNYKFTAEPAEGCTFDSWTVTYGTAGSSTYTDNPHRHSFQDPSQATVTANFSGTAPTPPTPPTAGIKPEGAGTVSIEPEEGNAARYTAFCPSRFLR